MQVLCWECGASIALSPELLKAHAAGARLACPTCRAPVAVPDPGAQPKWRPPQHDPAQNELFPEIEFSPEDDDPPEEHPPQNDQPLWIDTRKPAQRPVTRPYVLAGLAGFVLCIVIVAPLVAIVMHKQRSASSAPVTANAPAELAAPVESTKPARPSRALAQTAVESFVKDFLVAPKTAEFLETKLVDKNDFEGQAYWTFSGKVDSQNRFGVFLRGTYRGELAYDRSEETFVLKLLFINDELSHASPELIEAAKKLQKAFEESDGK